MLPLSTPVWTPVGGFSVGLKKEKKACPFSPGAESSRHSGAARACRVAANNLARNTPAIEINRLSEIQSSGDTSRVHVVKRRSSTARRACCSQTDGGVCVFFDTRETKMAIAHSSSTATLKISCPRLGSRANVSFIHCALEGIIVWTNPSIPSFNFQYFGLHVQPNVWMWTYIRLAVAHWGRNALLVGFDSPNKK